MMTRSFSVTLHQLLRRLNAEQRRSSGKRGVRNGTEHGRETTSDLPAVVNVGPQANSLAASVFERPGHDVPVFDSRGGIFELTGAGGQKLAAVLRRSGVARLGNCGGVGRHGERKPLEAFIPILGSLDRSIR